MMDSSGSPARATFLPVLLAFLLLGSCTGGKSAAPEPTGGAQMTMQLTSSAFANGATIPAKYTCSGEDISPPLAWSDIPTGTQSQALIVDDPDAPSKVWVHWVLFNLPPSTVNLAANVPPQPTLPDGVKQGTNDFHKIGYGGPCPPSGPPHHYQFHIYALDTTLGLAPGASKSDVVKAMEGHVIGEGELVGLYQK